jgi:flagellar motor switch protein FliG
MADPVDVTVSDNVDSDRTAAVSGAQAAAILLMLLDEAEAATILRQCNPKEVKTLGAAMFATMAASETDIAAALDRFVGSTRALPGLAINAEPRIRNVISAAIGNIRADNILEDIAPETSAATLDILRWMDGAAIAHLLANEPAQVASIILAVLTPETAAAALEGLDESRQADLVLRAARLTSVSADALSDLEALLAQASAPSGKGKSVKLGGRSNTARIVNGLKKPTSDKLLKSLKKRDRQLAQEIEDEMVVFGSLIDLDGKALGELMRAVDTATLGLALRGADPALADKMLATMSARAAQSLRDDIAETGPAKRAEVEEAQKAVIIVARALADAGTISLGATADDYV